MQDQTNSKHDSSIRIEQISLDPSLTLNHVNSFQELRQYTRVNKQDLTEKEKQEKIASLQRDIRKFNKEAQENFDKIAKLFELDFSWENFYNIEIDLQSYNERKSFASRDQLALNILEKKPKNQILEEYKNSLESYFLNFDQTGPFLEKTQCQQKFSSSFLNAIREKLRELKANKDNIDFKALKQQFIDLKAKTIAEYPEIENKSKIYWENANKELQKSSSDFRKNELQNYECMYNIPFIRMLQNQQPSSAAETIKKLDEARNNLEQEKIKILDILKIKLKEMKHRLKSIDEEKRITQMRNEEAKNISEIKENIKQLNSLIDRINKIANINTKFIMLDFDKNGPCLTTSESTLEKINNSLVG